MTALTELGVLEASGLVELARVEPELEYLFRHALVQDAAYGSLLKQDRRVLHRLAADTLLAMYPDRTRELAGVLAMHYERSGDSALAVEHLVVAGEHALERFANREALSFFERATELMPPDDQRRDLRLRATIGAAKVGWSFTASDAYIDHLDRALLAAGEGADQRLLADGYFWVAFLRRWRGEQPATSAALREALEQAARIGEKLGDPVAHAIPKAFAGVGRMFSGELRAGAADTAEALSTMEGRVDALSVSILSGFLSMGYARLGDFANAERTLATAERLAKDGDPIARLDASISRSVIELERGELAAGVARALECTVRSEELGAIACGVAANVMLGSGRLQIEDVRGARPPVERGLELSLVTNMAPMRTLAQGMRGSVRGQLGEFPTALGDWSDALVAARAMGDRYGEAMTLWGRGRTYSRQEPPDLAHALEDLEAATALAEAMETRPALARILRDRARALRGMARDGEALESDRRSRAIAAELELRDF